MLTHHKDHAGQLLILIPPFCDSMSSCCSAFSLKQEEDLEVAVGPFPSPIDFLPFLAVGSDIHLGSDRGRSLFE